jgi:hypothetical protein
MMKRRLMTPLLVASLMALPGLGSAETPTAEAVVERAISAVETESTLAQHDMLRIAINEDETASDGSTKVKELTAIVHGGRLENIRFELGQNISLALNNNTGWAMIQGQVDTRPQTPRMAAGNIRQTIFPLMLPFSLRMDGVQLGMVTEGSFDGTAAWVIDVNFKPDFFTAPSMLTTWRVFISRDGNLVLGAEFLPPAEFHAVTDEGIRYRILKRQDVDGLNLPAQVLLDGIDLNGVENGHVKVTKITTQTVGPLDLGLFINPEASAKLDAGDVF